MAASEQVPELRQPRPRRVRRSLWDGLLPEALGLCLVAAVFGGFVVMYVTAGRAQRQQSRTMREGEVQTLTQGLAMALGSLTQGEEAKARTLLTDLARLPGIRSVRWTTQDGREEYAWPPAEVFASGPPNANDEGNQESVFAAATIVGPSGEPLGRLRVDASSPAYSGGAQSYLLWRWGLTAAVTLLVVILLYRGLRLHLRPVAAIDRNLQNYAAGIEQELTALRLSDTLGGAAQGWNLLIEELSGLKQQADHAHEDKHVEDALARFEEVIFRQVVERLPFGVLCVGEDRCVSYANPAATSLLARRADEVVGHAVGTAVDDPAVENAVVGLEARGGAATSVDQTRKDGEHETMLRFRILSLPRPAAGNVAVVTVQDIGQLREDQRARDNFLYHVTHELRTPLTSISAYAETLTRPDFNDEQTRQECYNVIIGETRRLSRLVEDILSVSQLEVGTARLNVGQVDLARLLREMVQDHLAAADEKGIDLTLTLPPKVPKIRGDKQRLAVLLTNLIGNAVKYTPRGGQARVGLEVTAQSVRITVADTGIGIAPADQAHVFEKFYRAADDEVQMITGSGLGLAIAREVARLHGGDIELDSERGKGATFAVALPVEAGEAAEVSV